MNNVDSADCIERFLAYLRIRTDQPLPDYESAVQFLTSVGSTFGLTCQTILIAPAKPAVVMTIEGQDPTLPSVFLNSHMDVVPAFPELWKFDPFAGTMDDDGKIYGRGTQDMKSVGMQYLEAVHRLKLNGTRLMRTIHVCFVPDEEIGGVEGMKTFVEMEQFRRLNVGICLDEGLASEDDIYRIYYAERSVWWFTVIATGNTGHGSQFIENTAAEKLHHVIGRFLELRKQEKAKLMTNKMLTIGDVICVNLTILTGGVQQNVIPSKFVATFDMRVPPTVDFKALQCQLNQWLEEAGEGVRIEYIHKEENKSMSSQSPDDPWWKTICKVLDQLGFQYQPTVFAGATDARYLRYKGIAAYGFSPIIHTPILLHDHNEYLHRDTYLEGIDTYVHLIEALANVP
uniref:N-acyl-aliphatic-L-amino acid amidohydrolase n=1 Tax=Trichuris muris TaxID=70415 RepID=A0A5S6QW05_TRIMR